MQERNIKKNLQKTFFSVKKKFPVPSPLPFTQAMAAKNITSPEGIFYTQNSPPPL